MSTLNLTNEKTQITFGNDNAVIKKYIAGLEGGRVLDTTGFTPTDILAGHVIIKKTADNTYAPMPVSDDAYAALPDGYEYAGIMAHSVQTAKPSAAVMTWGIVNEALLPYAITSIKTALVAALPHIQFTEDVED